MSDFTVRWSQRESRTPHARPLGVLFGDPQGGTPDGLTMTGADLLYYGGFQTAVLDMLGRVFREPRAESAGDIQLGWLEVLGGLLPAARLVAVKPIDAQDERYGMHHLFHARLEGRDGVPPPLVDATCLLDPQLLQAAIVHQSGALVRLGDVESVTDDRARRAAWLSALGGLLARGRGDGPAPGG